MGIETVATPLSWHDSLPHLETIKMGGIRQFLNRWKSFKDVERPEADMRFGDEVEFMLVKILDENAAERKREEEEYEELMRELKEAKAKEAEMKRQEEEKKAKERAEKLRKVGSSF